MSIRIERLGLLELTYAKLTVMDGAWPADYRALLARAGLSEPPEHMKREVAIMRKRRLAGATEWRDGTRGPASRNLAE